MSSKISSKENYFPANTPLSEINETIYTDYMFLAPQRAIEGNINGSVSVSEEEKENSLEPPF